MESVDLLSEKYNLQSAIINQCYCNLEWCIHVWTNNQNAPLFDSNLVDDRHRHHQQQHTAPVPMNDELCIVCLWACECDYGGLFMVIKTDQDGG